MLRNITVGIDVGTYAVRVVVAEHTKGNPVPKILGTGLSQSEGLRHGYVVNVDRASVAIKKAVLEAEKQSGIKIKRALISIGGISLSSLVGTGEVVISKADGEIRSHDIQKAVELSEEIITSPNMKIVFQAPVLYKLDGKELHGRPEGMRGVKFEVKTMFITALAQHIDDLIVAVSQAGVEVLGIIPSPIAASAVALSDHQKMAGCVLVNIGAETITLIVHENNIPISVHVFPYGGTNITKDIALGFQIGLEEAENVKTGAQPLTHSKKKYDEIVLARLSEIIELVESHLKKIKRAGLLPGGVVLTGGGSHMHSIEDLSRILLKLPSKIGQLQTFTSAHGRIQDASWFVATGLCILAKGPVSQSDDPSIQAFFKNVKQNIRSVIKQLLP